MQTTLLTALLLAPLVALADLKEDFSAPEKVFESWVP